MNWLIWITLLYLLLLKDISSRSHVQGNMKHKMHTWPFHLSTNKSSNTVSCILNSSIWWNQWIFAEKNISLLKKNIIKQIQVFLKILAQNSE
jgi:hypothetical protein